MRSLGPNKRCWNHKSKAIAIGACIIILIICNIRFADLTGNYSISIIDHISLLDRSDTHSKSSNNNAWCTKISSSLNVTSWPLIRYHKDYPNQTSNSFNHLFDSSKFASLEEDDSQARSTIDEFNNLRNTVLTPKLLKEGFVHGGIRPAKSFANHVLEKYTTTKNDTALQYQQPILIAVFGNSFTIGSNCGESSAQDSNECAWPGRLVRRWDEIFPTTNHTAIEWRMFQENAQTSGNIAQKLPSILDEYYTTKNVKFDVIILDNTITDINAERKRPWFEAIVRLLVKVSPDTVIISLVDALPRILSATSGGDGSHDEQFPHEKHYVTWIHDVQRHYGLTVVDIARMAGILRNKSSTEEDLLWPQTEGTMISSNGTMLDDVQSDRAGTTPVYWSNFLPKVRKTKYAYYPANHPPWPTHQYVADSVMYALLRVIEMGLGCDNEGSEPSSTGEINNETATTVAPKEDVDGCFICMNPLARIDAKSPQYRNIGSASNADSTTNITSSIISSGDWTWVTDERGKLGWQSEQFGSIIRFRLKISDKPSITITYMRSHATFGSLRVTFRTVPSPPLREADMDHLENGTIPSLLLTGGIPQFSLWETTAFPYRQDHNDVNAMEKWNLLNATVLSQMGSNSVEYIDMYVVNPNKSGKTRIKIQTVTSC